MACRYGAQSFTVAHLAYFAAVVLPAHSPPVSPAHKRVRVRQELDMHLVALETDAGLYCARQTQRVLRDWSFSGCLAGFRPALAAAVRTKGAGRRHTALAHRLHRHLHPRRLNQHTTKPDPALQYVLP